MATTKLLIRDFLRRLAYRPRDILRNATLRGEVATEVISWNLNLESDHVEIIVDTASSIGECMYAHMSYDYQRFAAVYTACLTYVDDLGSHISDAIGQFGQRLLHGNSQLHPA